MIGKNHLVFGLGAVPLITGVGMLIFTQNPGPLAMYLVGTITPDIDGDGGNTLIVKTFSIRIKRKGRPPIVIAPLAPVSMIIYEVFGHRAVMHYPEVWLGFSFVLFQLGVPLLWCYFFFLGCVMHLVGDGVTAGGLPVPPLIRWLIVFPIQLIYRVIKKKPLKSIPMLWERKGFPPPGSDGGKISFQDLIYENRLFLTPKFMRFKVGGPMETVAVVVIMAILFVLVDPIGNIGTSKSVMTSFQKGNDVVFAGFQKSYDFFSFVNANKGQIEGTISNTLQNARNTVNTPTTTN